jgi:2-keto-3-deoxy-L-rhamnonate aldolase RhmA
MGKSYFKERNIMTIFLSAWQQLASPQVTIAMASMGFDWIVVDLEHSSITTQEAETIFIAAERCNAKPFVRLPSADPYLARRLLDAGAVGILVPVVESKEAFDNFAQHCFFSPKGRRGLGLVRSNGWGENLKGYFDEIKPTLIAQIETKTGAQNIQNILSSEFLDGIMIGPYDLSASLGTPGNFNGGIFKDICSSVTQSARNHKKMVGYHQVEPNLVELQKRIEEGYDFIAYGTDIVALRHSLKGIKK